MCVALLNLNSFLERKSGNLVNEQIVTYHSMNIFNELSKTTSVQMYPEITVTFSPLKTCNQFDSCWDCLTHGTNFNCIWCPGLNKCSDNGIDRNYQVKYMLYQLLTSSTYYLVFQEWANEMCYDTRYSVTDLQRCPVKVQKSNHHFYNKTEFKNPRPRRIPPTKIITSVTSRVNH